MWTHYMENVWNSSHHTLRSLWHHLVVKLDYHWSFHLMKRTGLLVGITCSRVGHVTIPPNSNLYLRCNFISDSWVRIDTWSWWFNSFKSKWNTVSDISKTNNIQTRETIRLLQNRIFYWIREIFEEDGLKPSSLEPWKLDPWKSTSSKSTYTFWTLYKETVHVSMFDWSDWDWMYLLVDFIPTESKWIIAPPTMHFHSGHLKITS